jgi:hypothetical protein
MWQLMFEMARKTWESMRNLIVTVRQKLNLPYFDSTIVLVVAFLKDGLFIIPMQSVCKYRDYNYYNLSSQVVKTAVVSLLLHLIWRRTMFSPSVTKLEKAFPLSGIGVVWSRIANWALIGARCLFLLEALNWNFVANDRISVIAYSARFFKHFGSW